jgi:UDP-N-acetylglucosamine 2-epimerase
VHRNLRDIRFGVGGFDHVNNTRDEVTRFDVVKAIGDTMKIHIPSTSRSDEPNTSALMRQAKLEGIELETELGTADCAILLGDRSEMLDYARYCIETYIPYVHVGAGCVTRGSFDQRVRGMLTYGCAAAWAYTAAAYENTQRMVDAEYVSAHGVPVLDTLRPRGLKRLEFVLVAINPVTAWERIREEHDLVDEIAVACRELQMPVIWSHPNEDPGSLALARKLEAVWPGRSLVDQFYTFQNAIEECKVMVGNSSSALIEAPVLMTPYVDCGCRQMGRPGAMSLRGADITTALRTPIVPKESHYRHPELKACAGIMSLCMEVVNERI